MAPPQHQLLLSKEYPELMVPSAVHPAAMGPGPGGSATMSRLSPYPPSSCGGTSPRGSIISPLPSGYLRQQSASMEGVETVNVTNIIGSPSINKLGSLFSSINKSVSSAFSSFIAAQGGQPPPSQQQQPGGPGFPPHQQPGGFPPPPGYRGPAPYPGGGGGGGIGSAGRPLYQNTAPGQPGAVPPYGAPFPYPAGGAPGRPPGVPGAPPTAAGAPPSTTGPPPSPLPLNGPAGSLGHLPPGVQGPLHPAAVGRPTTGSVTNPQFSPPMPYAGVVGPHSPPSSSSVYRQTGQEPPHFGPLPPPGAGGHPHPPPGPGRGGPIGPTGVGGESGSPPMMRRRSSLVAGNPPRTRSPPPGTRPLHSSQLDINDYCTVRRPPGQQMQQSQRGRGTSYGWLDR